MITIRRALLVVIGLLVVSGVLYWIAWPRVRAEQLWQSIRSRGVLRIGIDPGIERFSFLDENGWAGFDADVAHEVANRLDLKVEPMPVGYDALYDALLTERVDISMSALVPDDARLHVVLFSEPYVDMGVRLIGPEHAVYSSPNDLRGRVGVLLGTAADRTARYYERRVPGMSRGEVNDAMQVIEEIRIGNFDWTMQDAINAIGKECHPIELHGGSLHPDGTRCFALQPQPYVLAANRSNTRLINEINRELQAMGADGTLDHIAQKWLSQSTS